jgi:hypothetical protein
LMRRYIPRIFHRFTSQCFGKRPSLPPLGRSTLPCKKAGENLPLDPAQSKGHEHLAYCTPESGMIRRRESRALSPAHVGDKYQGSNSTLRHGGPAVRGKCAASALLVAPLASGALRELCLARGTVHRVKVAEPKRLVPKYRRSSRGAALPMDLLLQR